MTSHVTSLSCFFCLRQAIQILRSTIKIDIIEGVETHTLPILKEIRLKSIKQIYKIYSIICIANRKHARRAGYHNPCGFVTDT